MRVTFTNREKAVLKEVITAAITDRNRCIRLGSIASSEYRLDVRDLENALRQIEGEG